MKTPTCLFILTAFSLAIFTTACSGASPSAQVETVDSTQETVEVPYTRYTNEARGLSFDIPEGWELKVKTDSELQFLVDLESPVFDPDTTDAMKVMTYSHVNLFIWDKQEAQTPEGFRDFIENLLAKNGYSLIEKGKSNLGVEDALYITMQEWTDYLQAYTGQAKYVLSARDTRGYYMSLVYPNTIGAEKEQEYLSILEHMSESFAWNEQ